jgi:hypothetical protein
VSELVFLFSADADIQSAFEFYEAFQSGRGDIFMRHLDVAFGQLRTFSAAAPIFHKSYHRLLVHGFPYGIFYTIEGVALLSLASWISAKTRRLYAEDFAEESLNLGSLVGSPNLR